MVIPERRFRSSSIKTTDLKDNKESGDKLDSSVNNFDEIASIQAKQPISNLESQNNFKENLLDKECVIYLNSGIKLQGYLRDYDEEVVILESLEAGEQMMIYQSTIATVQFKD